MNKFFAIYCVILLIAFEAASAKGYALSSLSSNQHHAGKNDTHYHK